MTTQSMPTPIQDALTSALQALGPNYLAVENESRGHGGYVPGKESHFKVIVVSGQFVGKRPVQRHQLVYGLAGDLLAPGGIHALSIHAYTPTEWQTVQVPNSPQCTGHRTP